MLFITSHVFPCPFVPLIVTASGLLTADSCHPPSGSAIMSVIPFTQQEQRKPTAGRQFTQCHRRRDNRLSHQLLVSSASIAITWWKGRSKTVVRIRTWTGKREWEGISSDGQGHEFLVRAVAKPLQLGIRCTVSSGRTVVQDIRVWEHVRDIPFSASAPTAGTTCSLLPSPVSFLSSLSPSSLSSSDCVSGPVPVPV